MNEYNKDDYYTLQVGKAGEERLSLLNKIYNSTSQEFLIKAGAPGKKMILDVACGTGEMTCWLAQHTLGTVLGIDLSEEQLAIAQNNAKIQGVENVRFLKLSVFDLDAIAEAFDFIYCRFLLVHIQNPELALLEMHKKLSQGGIIACEEATVSASFCYPRSDAFDKWLELWAALRKTNNTELNLGLKLPHMFEKAFFTDVQAQLVQPVLKTIEEKRILKLNTKETLNAALKAKFATSDEMQKLIDDLESLACDEGRFIGYVRNTQAWGRKGLSPSRKIYK